MTTVFKRASQSFLLVLAFAAASSTAAAQDARLRPGTTIRFATATSDTVHVAELDHATSDSLYLGRCGTCTRLSYSRMEVNRLAVFHPAHRGSRFLTGFGFGGLAGLGLGLLAATSCHGGDRCDGGIVLIPFGGLLGGLVGGLAGYLTAYSWDAIPQAAPR